jgi:hypothetical protein
MAGSVAAAGDPTATSRDLDTLLSVHGPRITVLLDALAASGEPDDASSFPSAQFDNVWALRFVLRWGPPPVTPPLAVPPHATPHTGRPATCHASTGRHATCHAYTGRVELHA